jgi:hypothetical protein
MWWTEAYTRRPIASGKDEIVADVRRLVAERDKLASGEREALLADLHGLADEHAWPVT